MQQISTPELLVKHLYNETSAEEATTVDNALTNDSKLQEEFNELQTAKIALDEADGELPGVSVIEKIMTFSKEQELTATH